MIASDLDSQMTGAERTGVELMHFGRNAVQSAQRRMATLAERGFLESKEDGPGFRKREVT
jgi:hypothetical protein